MSNTTTQPSLMDALYHHAAAIKSLSLQDPQLQLPQFDGIRQRIDQIAGDLTAMQAEIPLIQAQIDGDSCRERPRG